MANQIGNRFLKDTIKRSLAALLAGVSVIMLNSGCSAFQDNASELHVIELNNLQELHDLFSYSQDGIPLTMAHRGGARKGYPENALATFEHTLQHTWSLMEVDPRYTKDSVIVLFHDRTLERTSTGKGRVSDYTYEELRELKLKDPMGNVTGYRIPTLSKALEWAKGKTLLFLDNKDVPVEERVRIIKEHGAELYSVVMAYSYEDAKRVYELAPDVMIQVFIPDEESLRRFDATGIPWKNVIAFVTHYQPEDENIFRLINEKGALAMIGTSRTLDREYAAGKINQEELRKGYHEWFNAGVNIIEADLGIEAGKAAEVLRPDGNRKLEYFKTKSVF